MHAHACVAVWTSAHTCRGQRRTLSVFLCHCVPFSVTVCLIALSLGLLLSQKLSYMLDWMAPKLPWPSQLHPLQWWSDRHLRPCIAFYLKDGNLKLGLHAGTNILTHWAISLAPNNVSFLKGFIILSVYVYVHASEGHVCAGNLGGEEKHWVSRSWSFRWFCAAQVGW